LEAEVQGKGLSVSFTHPSIPSQRTFAFYVFVIDIFECNPTPLFFLVLLSANSCPLFSFEELVEVLTLFCDRQSQ